MSAAGATRRSPRSIKNLCNITTIPHLNDEQTATLLSLARCTGWAADQIANKFAEITGFVLSPEAIWDHYCGWCFDRNNQEEISPAEWDVMQVLMGNIGVHLDKPERSLSKTFKPRTIRFADKWSAKNPDSPLFSGYTMTAREATKNWLMHDKDPEAYGKLTFIEKAVLSKFGDNILDVLEKTLERWADAMLAKVLEDPGLRPIKERNHVDLIMLYLHVFQREYEKSFGKMESGKPSSACGEIKDNTVYIKSTGYGVKVVLGLLMADRLNVLERKRKLKRENIGFMEVEAEDLKHDEKDCPICQDPMGIKSPEGTKEVALRIVICCGQVIGARCLRAWLGERVYEDVYRDTCPTCRFKFPETFLKTLFSKEEYAARVAQEGAVDLVSPTPEPAEMMRAQQEHDAFLRRELGGGESGVGGEGMDVDTEMELHRPPPLGEAEPVRRRTALELFQQLGLPTGLPQVDLGELDDDEIMGDDFNMEG